MLLAMLLARPGLESFCDFRFLDIAAMKHEQIMECLIFAILDGVVAGAFGLLLKVMQAEGIGGDETVITGVPGRRMS